MSNRTLHRSATVVLAPIAALGAWGLLRAAGVHMHVSTGNGTVGAGAVVVTATVVSLLAWAIVHQLEHRVERPRQWWALIGSAGLSVSLIGPSHLAHGSSVAALIGLHVVTALVVVIGFMGTLPCRPATTHAELPA